MKYHFVYPYMIYQIIFYYLALVILDDICLRHLYYLIKIIDPLSFKVHLSFQ